MKKTLQEKENHQAKPALIDKWRQQAILLMVGCHPLYNRESLALILGRQDFTWQRPEKMREEVLIDLSRAGQAGPLVVDLRAWKGKKLSFSDLAAHQGFLEEGKKKDLACLLLLDSEDPLSFDDALDGQAYDLLGPADLVLDTAEAHGLLKKAGFTKGERASLMGFCQGDLGMLGYMLTLKKNKAYWGVEEIQKHMLGLFSRAYRQAFSLEERRSICRLQYIKHLESEVMDRLMEETDQAHQLIQRLMHLGLIVEKEWGRYYCSPILGGILNKEAYTLFKREERKERQAEEIRFLARANIGDLPLDLAFKTQKPEDIQVFFKSFISSFEEIFDERKVTKVYQLGKEYQQDDSMAFHLIALIYQTYQGNSQEKYRLTDLLMERWEEVDQADEGIFLALSLFVCLSLLEKGQAQRAKDLIENHMAQHAFSQPGFSSLVWMLDHHVKVCMKEARASDRDFIYHKNRVMGLNKGKIWLIFSSLSMEGDLLKLLASRKEYEHFYEEILRLSEKKTSQHFYYQILRRIYEIQTTLSARDFSNELLFLQQRIDNDSNVRVKIYGYLLLTLEHLLDGKVNMAWGKVDEVLYYSKISGNRLMHFQALLLKTYLALRKNRPGYAWQIIEKMEGFPFPAVFPFQFFICRIKAMLYMTEKSYPQAQSALEAYVQGMEANDCHLFVLDGYSNLAYLAGLAKKGADEKAAYLAKIEERVRRMDMAALFRKYLSLCPALKTALSQLAKTEEDEADLLSDKEEDLIRIQLFQEFKISYKGLSLREDAWKTRKVKGILQYLLLHPDQRIPRSELIKAFWPDIEDGSQAAANLRVALSLLGKSLGQINLRYILQRNRQRVWLDLSDKVLVDVDQALRAYDQAKDYYKEKEYQRAERMFVRAEKCWEQPFLIAQKKEDWAKVEKEKCRKSLERCRYYLLHIAMEAQQPSKTVLYCKKIITTNPYREDIYRILIATLKRQGRLGEAVQIFKDFKSLIREELKIRPSKNMLAMESSLGETLYEGRI